MKTTITKQQAQSAGVSTVKAIVYPLHLVAQTTADLLAIGQAQAIKAIDGTEVFESIMNCQSWTQEQQAKVVSKAMAIKEKMDRQRDANIKQDIEKFKAKLDKLEGVEHINEMKHGYYDQQFPPLDRIENFNEVATFNPVIEPAVESVISDNDYHGLTPTDKDLAAMELRTNRLIDHEKSFKETIIPAPPVEAPKKIRAPRKPKEQSVPLMTVPVPPTSIV